MTRKNSAKSIVSCSCSSTLMPSKSLSGRFSLTLSSSPIIKPVITWLQVKVVILTSKPLPFTWVRWSQRVQNPSEIILFVISWRSHTNLMKAFSCPIRPFSKWRATLNFAVVNTWTIWYLFLIPVSSSASRSSKKSKIYWKKKKLSPFFHYSRTTERTLCSST